MMLDIDRAAWCLVSGMIAGAVLVLVYLSAAI